MGDKETFLGQPRSGETGELAGDSKAEQLNTTMALGLAARSAASAYITGIDNNFILGIPSQEMYDGLLHDLLAAGTDYDEAGDYNQTAIHMVYERLYSDFNKVGPASHEQFYGVLAEVLALRDSAFYHKINLKAEDRTKLMLFDLAVRRSGEKFFLDTIDPYVSTDEYPDFVYVNGQLMYGYCDTSYWEHSTRQFPTGKPQAIPVNSTQLTWMSNAQHAVLQAELIEQEQILALPTYA